MIKKKKIAEFRELYDYISELLESYSYDDVSKIIAKEKGVNFATGTLKSYVSRHRQELAKSQNDDDEREKNTTSEKTKIASEDQTADSTKDVKSNDDNQDSQNIDLDGALETLKNKASNKSILD